MPQQISFKNSTINFCKFGNGPKILFCLQGYGEDGTSFSFLEQQLGSVYTLYAIDLPFHGATIWNEQALFTAEDLMNLFNFINPNHVTFSILAFSFGGRIALFFLQKFPDKIEHIVLIAPDGLHVNFWYWLTTETWLGNKLFSLTMKHPQYLFCFLAFADKANLLNKSIVKFIHYYLDDKSERSLLYKRWTCMKKFKPDLHAIKKLTAEKNITMQFLFGKFDKIILSKHADVFKYSPNIRITTIDAGHRLLSENYASHIVALLNNQF